MILTGKIPHIVDSFIIEAHGQLRDLKQTKFRSSIEIDPKNKDFFKVVIEERKKLTSRTDLSDTEKNRLDKALKVLANSTSYGIYAEMNRQETGLRTPILCYGLDSDPFPQSVTDPEIPGEYCFPPLASLITGAARLMLAMLEKCVTDLGGTYAMEDTDSMAIVATAKGGTIESSADFRRREKSGETVHALSWGEVEQIAARFRSLNPYDKSAIPGSILEIEDENFDPKTGEQRQLWCYAISAKRYALFLQDKKGAPELLRSGGNNEKDRWSQHGLGHLLNPTEILSEDRGWIAQVWQGILNDAFHRKGADLNFWDVAAVGRTSVSAPPILNSLAMLNSGKDYSGQVKPFNFLLSCHVKQFGQPVGVDPARFHLIAPYDADPSRWTRLKWIDLYSGKLFGISTAEYSSRQTASVKTFGDFISDYRFHAESKCADMTGEVCSSDTPGLLQRRHVQLGLIRFIGKESNLLEQVEEGLVHSTSNVYGEVIDQRRDEWERKIRPALAKFSISALQMETHMSPRALKNARTGKTRPHPGNQARIVAALRRMGIKI